MTAEIQRERADALAREPGGQRSKSRRDRCSMWTRITAGPRDGGSYHVAASDDPVVSRGR